MMRPLAVTSGTGPLVSSNTTGSEQTLENSTAGINSYSLIMLSADNLLFRIQRPDRQLMCAAVLWLPHISNGEAKMLMVHRDINTKRPGWNVPVHQLMIDNGVAAYFHGHDHQFVHEEIDGIVYQLVPSPSMNGYGFDLYDNSPTLSRAVIYQAPAMCVLR